MIGRRLEDITAADIQSLVDNKVAESKTLEYKLALPGNSDTDKKEFVADVVSFANSGGGDIVYGISEQSDDSSARAGYAVRIIGLQFVNFDTEILRLSQIVGTGTDPRLTSVRMREVPIPEAGSVLVVRIGQSWTAPHRSLKDREFHIRVNNGKSQMNTLDLRMAFNAGQSQFGALEAIRQERRSRLLGGATPAGSGMNYGPILLIDLIPINAVYPLEPLAIDEMMAGDSFREGLRPPRAGGWNSTPTFEGFASYCDRGYAQVFRNGMIEYATSDIWHTDNNVNWLESNSLVRALIASVEEGLRLHQSLDVSLPIHVLTTLVNVSGYLFAVRGTDWRFEKKSPYLDILDFPPVRVEQFSQDVHALVRTTLHAVWQAFGHKRCSYYALSGEWKP